MSAQSPSNIPATLTPDFFSFIFDHLNDDPIKLRLAWHNKKTVFDIDFALTQIECRKKTAKKLKSFLLNREFIFPTTLSAEQASHQAIASYHASLITKGSLLDMTAGLGIDVLSMTDNADETVAIELDSLKANILNYNASILGKKNLKVINGDSVEWINASNRTFDTIFIDPARRKEDNSRAYNFHDCLPDVISLQESTLKKGGRLLIKASPLLDITQTLKDIKNVSAIRAVCVQGECKEILVEAFPNHAAVLNLKPKLKLDAPLKKEDAPNSLMLFEALDLNEVGDVISCFNYSRSSADQSSSNLSESHLSFASEEDIKKESFLYEPNAAVMKLAPWEELCIRFPELKKLAPSSHLFVSSELYNDFPGRILKIEKLVDKKDRKTLKSLPVNIVVRNYPMTVADLRKNLKAREGTDLFLYGTTLSKPVLILANRSTITK